MIEEMGLREVTKIANYEIIINVRTQNIGFLEFIGGKIIKRLVSI